MGILLNSHFFANREEVRYLLLKGLKMKPNDRNLNKNLAANLGDQFPWVARIYWERALNYSFEENENMLIRYQKFLLRNFDDSCEPNLKVLIQSDCETILEAYALMTEGFKTYFRRF